MKKTMGGSIALTALLALLSVPVAAQDDDQERRGMRRGADIESIMSIRERLELTEDQVRQLDALRAEEVERRGADRAAMAEMRSQLRAGQIERSEMMAFMEQRRDARPEIAEATRSRIDEILQPEQRESLDQYRAERRAYERGRQSGRREAGMRGRGGGGERAFQRGPRSARGFERGPRSERRFQRGLRRGPGGPGGVDDSGAGSDFERPGAAPATIDFQGMPGSA